MISRAAELGCPAFSGSRIHRVTLQRWLAEHGDEAVAAAESGGGLRSQKLTEEIRRLRIANDAKAGKLVARMDVVATHDRILARARVDLERVLVHEMPTAVAGADVPTARMLGRRYADMAIAALAACAEEWKA